MWNISLLFVLLINFCHTLPNGLSDMNPDETKLYDQFSKDLSDDLEVIGNWLSNKTNLQNSSNVYQSSTSYTPTWHRVAVENNVTVDQLKSIFQFSHKLRTLQLSETGEIKNNETGESLREACQQYLQGKINHKTEITTLATTTKESQRFWESVLTAFVRPLSVGIASGLQASMFVNATTTAERLRIFESLCKTVLEI